jgi:hypothetical protein
MTNGNSADEVARLLREVERLSKLASVQKALLADAAEGALRLNTEPDWLARALSIPPTPIPEIDDETLATLHRLQERLQRAAQELGENRHALVALRHSGSWRLTAPLRGVLDGSRTLILLFGFGRQRLWGVRRMLGVAQWMVFRNFVRRSGLFDELYYLASNPKESPLRMNPMLDFFVYGSEEGRKPNCLFEPRFYRENNPDIARSVMNPLVHYLKWGAYEGRDPNPQFDSSYYLENNADVREARANPLAHYLAPGVIEGRDPNAWFDTSDYLERNPDVAALGLNPLAHFVEAKQHVFSRRSGL